MLDKPTLTHFSPTALDCTSLPDVEIVRVVTLYRVPGFAMHRLPKDARWFVSHISTGARAGTGSSPIKALRDARNRVRNLHRWNKKGRAWNVRYAIQKTRSILSRPIGED